MGLGNPCSVTFANVCQISFIRCLHEFTIAMSHFVKVFFFKATIHLFKKVKKILRYLLKGYITAIVGKLTHLFGIGGNYKDVFILTSSDTAMSG